MLALSARAVWQTRSQSHNERIGQSLANLSWDSLQNPAYLIEADHGAVASEQKRCSDIGVNVLK